MITALLFLAIAVFSLLLVVGVGLIFQAMNYRQFEQKKALSWPELAAAHQLTLGRGHWGKGVYIEGRYRSHRLKVETLFQWRENGRTDTQISLISAAGRPIAPEAELLPAQQRTVRKLTRLLDPKLPADTLKGQKIEAAPGGESFTYRRVGLEGDQSYLNFLIDLLADLAEAYPLLVALGGEQVPALMAVAGQANHPLQRVAGQLLDDIERETTARLAGQAARLLCPACLARCTAHTLPLSPLNPMTYYGCRICGQSRTFLEVAPGQVVAVLDEDSPTEPLRQQGALRVNWLRYRKLFDFDRIEIIRADDEAVERFAVQAGNETDLARRAAYATIPCAIAPDCLLSENSRRILERLFGPVEVKGRTAVIPPDSQTDSD